MKSFKPQFQISPKLNADIAQKQIRSAIRWSAFVCAIATGFRLYADLIPIINPSFEAVIGPANSTHFDVSGKLRDGHWTYHAVRHPGSDGNGRGSGDPIPGWQASMNSGSYNPTSGDFSPQAPNGINVAFLSLDPLPQSVADTDLAISQILCHALAPGRYTFRVAVGNESRTSRAFAGYRIQLRVDGNVVAEDFNSVSVAESAFANVQVIANVPADHPSLGKAVEIRLAGAQPAGTLADVYFDNVSLDFVPSRTNNLPCPILANSVSEFSLSQGAGNWYYGYYSSTGDLSPGYNPTNEFTQLTLTNRTDLESCWNLGLNFYTLIGAGFMHPNTADFNTHGATPREDWAIRRWVSEYTGLVRIGGLLAKEELFGDGIVGSILVNGKSVYEQAIGGTDGVGVRYSVVVGLREGQFVDFVLKDGGTIDSDLAYFTAIIEPAEQTLSVQTAVEISVPSVPLQRFQLEASNDLQTWLTNGLPNVVGTGEIMNFLFSPREHGSYRYFRARNIP